MIKKLLLVSLIAFTTNLYSDHKGNHSANTYAVLEEQVTTKNVRKYRFITAEQSPNSEMMNFESISKSIGLNKYKHKSAISLVQHLIDNGWNLISVSATPPSDKEHGFIYWQKTSYHLIKK